MTINRAMTYDLSFKRTDEGYLLVTAHPSHLQRDVVSNEYPLSAIHANERVFIHLLSWAGLPPLAKASLATAAEDAWHDPAALTWCKDITLVSGQLSYLCLSPKLHKSA